MDGYAAGPLVTVSADRTACSFAVRTPRGVSVRSTRIDPAQWPEAATVAAVESALHGGMHGADAERLVEALDQAIAAAGDGGFGCTEADRAALAAHVSGLEDAEAWRVHGLKALAALIWFSPRKPLVSLRAQPLGERPSPVGEWLNRLGEPKSLARAAMLCVLMLVVAPPLFAGGRLLLLQWKIGDLDGKERALRAYQKEMSLYADLERRAWPMGKLLGDLANVTPEGVEWEDLLISQDRNVTVHGLAKPHENQSGNEVILQLEKQMRDSRVFDKVTKRMEPSDGKGMVKFTLSATVAKPTLRPAYKEAQDFARKTLAERRYGTQAVHAAAKAAADAGEGDGTESAGHGGETAAQGKTAAPPSDLPAIDPLKDEHAPHAAPTVASGAGESPEGADKGDTASRRGGRATRAGATKANDIPKRSERTPDSANHATPIPPALTDAEIDAMSKEEAQAAISKVAIARQSAEVDDDTKKRLKDEFDKLTKHLRGKK
jgi:Tfp pilus assembly protein PilN